MSDEKKPEPPPEAAEPPVPADGKTLRVHQEYHLKVMCKCGAFIPVRIFDGMPPRGHDDNIVYQEVLMVGVKKCEQCAIVMPPTGIVTLN